MKVIDLLNKIANGEEVPKKIKYNNETFTIREEKDDYTNQNNWFTDRFSFLDLNEEIEIIEEDKKIKRIGKLNQVEDKQNLNNYMLRDKINEIIDVINRGD